MIANEKIGTDMTSKTPKNIPVVLEGLADARQFSVNGSAAYKAAYVM
jgi:hypothetical protein